MSDTDQQRTQSNIMQSMSDEERADVYLLQLQFVANSISEMRQAVSIAIQTGSHVNRMTSSQRGRLSRANNVIFGAQRRRDTQELLMRLKRRIMELNINHQ